MRGCGCHRHRKYGPRTETPEDRRLRSDMHEISYWQNTKTAHEELIAAFNDPAINSADKEDHFHLKAFAPPELCFGCKDFPFFETDTHIEYAKSLGRSLGLRLGAEPLEQQFRFDGDALVIETHRGAGVFLEVTHFPLCTLYLELEIVENPHKEGCIKKDLVVRVHYTQPTDSLDSSGL